MCLWSYVFFGDHGHEVSLRFRCRLERTCFFSLTPLYKTFSMFLPFIVSWIIYRIIYFLHLLIIIIIRDKPRSAIRIRSRSRTNGDFQKTFHRDNQGEPQLLYTYCSFGHVRPANSAQETLIKRSFLLQRIKRKDCFFSRLQFYSHYAFYHASPRIRSGSRNLPSLFQ